MTRALPRGAASRGLAAAIAKYAASEEGVFCTLRTFAPVSDSAPWETFGGVLAGPAYRPLFVVSDHGVMRNASVLVRGADVEDRFETPKGPLLPPKLGALVAASSRALGDAPTILDAAFALLERVHSRGVRLELLGRWEGTLGARFDAGPVGPLAFFWQRPSALTLAVASRAPTGRLSVPVDEGPIATLTDLPAAVERAALAIERLV